MTLKNLTVIKNCNEVKNKIILSSPKNYIEVLGNTNPELKKIKKFTLKINDKIEESNNIIINNDLSCDLSSMQKNKDTDFIPKNENLDIFNDKKFFIEDNYKKNKDIIDQKNINKIYQIPLNYNARVKSWCLTIFSLPDMEPKFIEKDMRYLVYGSEIAPKTKKHHFQTFVYFHNAKSFSQVRTYFFKLLGFYPHIEKARGNIEENLAYCSKDEKYKEFGKKPAQGERTDIKAAVEDIIEGKVKPIDIMRSSPEIYNQFRHTFEKARYYNVYTKERTEMTQGYWYYGKSARGKSHIAFTKYPDRYIFKGTGSSNWWDGYTGQETILFNDFRGTYPFQDLLTLVDKWGEVLNVRSIENVNMISKNVVVTSLRHPKEIYKKSLDSGINEDLIQFYRRFIIIKLLKKNGKIEQVKELYEPDESEINDINDENPHIFFEDGEYKIKVEHLLKEPEKIKKDINFFLDN
jgi:hypothetical protein